MPDGFVLYLDGEPAVTEPDLERVQLERDDDGIEHRCANCFEPLVEYDQGLKHEDGSYFCFHTEHGTESDLYAPGGPVSEARICEHLRKDHDVKSKAVLTWAEVHAAEHSDEIVTPERIPLAWANSAAITLDTEDDEITVSISVGDPRGAFAFTVRRIADSGTGDLAGRLVMHTPYPDESLPHAKLTEIRPGTYLIGD